MAAAAPKPSPPLLAALALAALAHLPALRAGFVQDDHVAVETSPVVATGALAEIVTGSWWQGSPLDDRALWRPVTVATFALERGLTGAPSSALAHGVNVALHLAACALLYGLARALGAEPFAGFAAAALFGVLPVRAEAVYSVVGRADVLAGLFTLAAAIAFRDRASRARGWLAGLFVAAAIASKETGLAAPAVLAAIDAIEGRPWRSFRGWLPVIVAVAAATALRTWSLEAFFPAPNLPPMDNPIAYLDPGARFGTALGLVARYARLAVAPAWLANDYSGPSVPAQAGLLGAWAVAGAAIAAAWAVVGALPWIPGKGGASARVAASGAALVVFPYLIVSNLLKPIGVSMAERLVYLPAAGACLAAGAGLAALERRKLAGAILAVAALAGAGRTFARGFDWKDDRTVFEATTRANPSSPRAWYAVARIDADALADPAANRASRERILAGYDRALVLYGDYPFALHGKGRLLARSGDLAAAEPLLREAVRRGPAFSDAWLDLGLVLQRRGALDEAARALRKAVLFDPSQAKAWASLGHLAFDAGRFAQAAAFYGRAVPLGRPDLASRMDEARRRAGAR